MTKPKLTRGVEPAWVGGSLGWQDTLLHSLSSASLVAQLMAVAEAYLAGVLPGASLGLWVLVSPMLGLLSWLILWAGRRARSQMTTRGASLGVCLLSLALYGEGLQLGSRWVLSAIQSLTLLPHILFVLALLLALVLAPLCSLFSSWARVHMTSPRQQVTLMGVGVSVLCSSLCASLLMIFKDPPLLAFGLLAVATTLTYILITRGPLSPLGARLIFVGSLASASVSLAHLGVDASAREQLTQARGLSALLIPLARQLSDQDRDGFGVWLGGGDCDDEDPTRHPLAFDVPGNGVDEDCDGADERIIATPVSQGQAQVTADPTPHSNPKAPWNLLIITIDALRADHVSWAGYARALTPRLSELTRSGLVFTRAYTPCADTRYSIPPLMSGQPLHALPLDWRGRYLILDPKGSPDERGGTIFERLKRQGYETTAMTGELMVDGMWYGLERGLDRLYGDPQVSLRARSSARLTHDARQQLQAWARKPAPQPWALWLHYIDPHEPYLSHDKHRFGGQALDRYDGEVASTDEHIGRLLDELERLGLKDRTIIVLSADHGEEFEEHGRHFHGKQLYDESIRVPFVISVPGAPQVTLDQPVSTMDMVETLTELMGLPAGEARVARSHAGRLRGERGPDGQPVITYRVHNTRPQLLGLSLVEWPYKLIYEPQTRRGQLFQLQRDPAEREVVNEQAPQRYQALIRQAKREAQRFKRGIFESLYARHVRRPSRPPQAGEPITSGVTLVRRSSSLERVGERTLYSVKAELYVRAPVTEHVRFKLQWRGASGEVSKTLAMEPLGGLYPPRSWRVGELITLESLERLTAQDAHQAELIIERSGGQTLTFSVAQRPDQSPSGE